MLKLAWGFLVAHIVALITGLVGILVMLPQPQIWMNSPGGPEAFRIAMQYGGSAHINLATIAMVIFGGHWIGWRRTMVFFAAGTILPLSFELLGTTTGFPFGHYRYTGGLGWEVLGRVPYTIPLSWFYMGFASYLLANTLTSQLRGRVRSILAVVLGAYFLMVWDLVLDPAMASETLPIRFWVWDEVGPYFGMPAHNFLGWFVVGLLYMAISRRVWKQDLDPASYPAYFPFLMYLANMVFAMVISASVGLWPAIIAALVLGVVPVSLALRRPAARLKGPSVSAATP